MKHFLALVLAVCTLPPCLQAQKPQPSTPTSTLEALESHVMANPGFERPFYDLLTEGLDETSWKNLDARWDKREAADPRHCLLRGLLAERLGQFETALKHYERANTDDWGRYHQARLLAFLGRTEPAKQALQELAHKTTQPWIFAEAARGVGELMLLTEDMAAAEKHHVALWEARGELDMRMSLMEPLLTLRMELGTGREWLKTLEPKFAATATTFSVAETDQALLWFWGSSLTQLPAVKGTGEPPYLLGVADPYLHAERMMPPEAPWFPKLATHGDVGRWYGTLFRKMRMPMAPCPALVLAESLARQPVMDDEAARITLFLAATEDAASLVKVAETLKKPLSGHPSLLNLALRSRPEVVAQAREELDRKVFAGTSHPQWRLWSLALRSQHGGEKPEALTPEARALWSQVRAEDIFPPTYNLLSQAREADAHSTLLGLSRGFSRPGVHEPSTSVVWNMRGDTFVRAMEARFPYDLEHGIWRAVTSSPPLARKNDPAPKMADVVAVDTGLQLRFMLWQMRQALGLDGSGLDQPPTLEARVQNALAQGDAAAISQLVVKEDLGGLPLPRLLAVKQVVDRQQNMGDRETAPPDLAEAGAKLARTLVERLPGWVIPALMAPLPLPQSAPLNDGQRQELLVSYHSRTSRGRKEEQEVRTKNWELLVPAVTDEQKLAFELLNGKQSLALNELPHALWGLQWHPSLRRERALMTRRHDPTTPPSPPFFMETLPALVSQQREHGPMPMMMMDRATRSLSSLVSLKIMTRFGFSLQRPQAARLDELRGMAAKHPFARDLADAWEALDTHGTGARTGPMLERYDMSPWQISRVLEALKQPASRDTRLMLMVLQQRYGEPDKARPFEDEFKELFLFTEPPAASAADDLSKPPSGPGPTPPVAVNRPQPKRMDTLSPAEAAAAAEKLVQEAVDSKDESRFFSGRSKSMRQELQNAYDWLKKQDRSASSFAARSASLATLARVLKVSAQELEEAENLDQKLHPEDPTRWLRVGRNHARAGKPKEALDAFFEALRRADLSDLEDYSRLRPPEEDWHQLAIKNGRDEELAEALAGALARTPEQEAKDIAADMLDALAAATDTVAKPERLTRLLDVVLKHQRHVILASFEKLNEAIVELEKAGKADAATQVTRVLLQGVWPGTKPERRFESFSAADNLPQGVQDATSGWNMQRSPDEVGPESAMKGLLGKALRGSDAAAFVAGLARDAATYPKDEQLVSCAAVAGVMQGGNLEELFRLADQLDPQPRMRVAWRLCELTRPRPGQLALLAPALARGLEALFQDPTYQGNGSRHFLLAEMVLPWLEQAGAEAELKALMPVFAKELEATSLMSNQWYIWADIAQRHKAPALVDAIVKQLARQCEQMIANDGGSNYGFYDIPGQLCLLAARQDAETGHSFAMLADDMWTAFVKKHGNRTDPSALSLIQLCDQLVAYGEPERLMVRISQIESILRLGGQQDYERVLERAREGLEFLRSPNRLAKPSLRVEDLPGDESTGRVHWELITRPPYGNPIVLKRTTKKHHLKILAGKSLDALQSVGEVPLIAVSGVVEVKGMPTSGYAQGMVCDESSRLLSVGGTTTYSLRHPLLDSDDGSMDSLPEWRDEWLQTCGRPVSKIVPVDAGLSVLAEWIGQRPQTQEAPMPQFLLVGLDENKKPLGTWAVADDRSGLYAQFGEERSSSVLRLSAGYHSPFQHGPHIPPHHIVLTEMEHQAAGAREPSGRVQVRVFQSREPPVVANLPELQAMPLASVGFPIRSWQLCENHPRAVFCGESEVVVFDTDASPWKELLRLQDPKIAEGGWVIMLNADVACFGQTFPGEQVFNFTPHVWQLRCVGPDPLPTALKDCPEIPLPKMSLRMEVSPEEDAAVFTAPVPNGNMLQILWLDSTHKTSLIKVERAPANRNQTWPYVAWWPAGGKDVVMEDNGIQYQLTLTPEGLRSGKMARGKADPFSVPSGATPGQRLTAARWVLKDQNILVEMNQSGQPRQAYKVPGAHTGKPLWWGRRHQSVLLQTSDNNLIMVQPQNTKSDR